MASSPKRGRGLRKTLLICVLLLICVAIGLAAFNRTRWNIPTSEKEKKNPLTYSEANITAAKEIYSDKCANCHGDKGMGDGSDAMMYDPPPADLTDAAKMKKLTDGEIYYQITEGRKPMPSFKKKLTDEQRWQLVLFVRSLANPPSAPTAKQPPAPGNGQPQPPPSKKN